MTPNRIAGPDFYPFSVVEARQQCRVSDNSSDLELGALIEAACHYAEDYTGRYFLQCSYELRFDEFPEKIVVPGYVRSVGDLAYVIDATGNTAVVDPSSYYAKADGGDLELIPKTSWPTAYCRPDAVRLTYEAGLEQVDPLLSRIRSAVLLHVEAHYDRDSTQITTLTTAAKNLLDQLRKF